MNLNRRWSAEYASNVRWQDRTDDAGYSGESPGEMHQRFRQDWRRAAVPKVADSAGLKLTTGQIIDSRGAPALGLAAYPARCLSSLRWLGGGKTVRATDREGREGEQRTAGWGSLTPQNSTNIFLDSRFFRGLGIRAKQLGIPSMTMGPVF
jgi:hypothetical protein